VLEPGLAGIDRLRKLVMELRDPVSLLSDPITWPIIVNLLPYDKTVSLGELLGVSDPRIVYDKLRSMKFVTEARSRKASLRAFFGVVTEEQAAVIPIPVCQDEDALGE